MGGPVYVMKQKDQKAMPKQQGCPAPILTALVPTAPQALRSTLRALSSTSAVCTGFFPGPECLK